MSKTDYSSEASIGRPKSAIPRGEGYEWTCPYCGDTRLNTSSGEPGEENAITALRIHIHVSEGSGHGPRRRYPPGYDSRKLAEHVVEVDSRD